MSALERLIADPHGGYVLAVYGLALLAMAGLGLWSGLRLAAWKRRAGAEP